MRQRLSGLSRLRALASVVAAVAVIGALVDPGPAQAATIPPVSAICGPGNPVVSSFAASATSVNVTTKPGRMTWTVKASDTGQDITKITLGVVSAFRSTPLKSTVTFTRTAGTAQDGTWTGSLAIPKYSQDGTWGYTELEVFDAGRAESVYSTDSSSGSLGWAWPRQFQVVSKNDLTTPTITAVKLSHPSANTSTQTQTLVASVTTKDNLAGVARITVEGFVTVSGHTYFTRGGTLVIKTPTAKAHTYKVSFLVPKGVGSGTHTWSLLVTAVDAAGIVKSLTRAQLLAKHFTSTFKVASRTDVTPPKLTGLTFSTTSVNALSADQKVTVTVKATDSGAGVSAALVNLSTANGFTANVPPHDYAAAASPTGAIGNSVTWKATLTIPRCSDPGTWTVANVQLTDATSSPNGGAGNTATYTTGQLSTKGLPTTLDVQALDTTAPRFTTPAQAPVASPVVVTFTEPTLWTDNDLLSVEDYTAGQAPVAGTWTCRNSGATVVGCADDDADVVTATFQPSADLTSGDLYFVIAAFSPYARTKGIFDTSGNGPTQWADTFTGS